MVGNLRRTLRVMNAQVSTFSGTQACDIVGITYRQLDYWARTQLVRPAIHEATAIFCQKSVQIGEERSDVIKDWIGMHYFCSSFQLCRIQRTSIS